MSVWFAIPSARPPEEAEQVLAKWRERGYRIALFRDAGSPRMECDLWEAGAYRGYCKTVNRLCKDIFRLDSEAQVVVTGGDDVEPEPYRTAAELEKQFIDHFSGTFGVMQPTGDRWMVDESGRAASERICGSPWIGRRFAQSVYGGAGPLYPGYFHFYEDEELQEVALRLEVLWQRPDLTHFHHHWMRNGGRRPVFLDKAQTDWDKAKLLFENRKQHDFPGHIPLWFKEWSWQGQPRYTCYNCTFETSDLSTIEHHVAEAHPWKGVAPVYSQGGEEEVILEALAGKPGRLLDIGAYDGKTFSNSLRLIEMGWGGVLIEPSLDAFKGLVKLYSGSKAAVTLIHAAVGVESGLVLFYNSPDAVSTTLLSHKEKWEERAQFDGSFYVPQITVEQIINQFGEGGFDFVSIDTEGTSTDIFLRLPLAAMAPRAMCVEHDGRSVEVAEHGRSYGYAVRYLDGNNIVLVRG